jgi:hypothetical protein
VALFWWFTRFFVDSSSNCRYLVDTGSAFSIMPWRSPAPPSGPSLCRADSRRIPCWGEWCFAVTISSVPRQWVFLLVAMSFPILGTDVLKHHLLVVDVVNLRLSLLPHWVIAGCRAVIHGCSAFTAGGMLPAISSLPSSLWRLLYFFCLSCGHCPPRCWRVVGSNAAQFLQVFFQCFSFPLKSFNILTVCFPLTDTIVLLHCHMGF